jgi:hypothetical protein
VQAEEAKHAPLRKLLEYADDSDGSQYGTLSTDLVRKLVNEALCASDLVTPMDAWVAHAKRAGWLNEDGIASDRHGANIAFNSYSAGWNDAVRAAPGSSPIKQEMPEALSALLTQARDAMRRLLDASFEDAEGMHRFAEDVLPAYAVEGVETSIAAIERAVIAQKGNA